MPDRPLLILPSPSEPERRNSKGGGGGKIHLPTRQRQTERLAPRFEALARAFDARRARLQVEPGGITPEDVVVLETAGPVANFIVAVRNIAGLEWLGEIEEEDVPADDDFFVADRSGGPRADKALRGRVFLIFSNQQALRQMFSLWEAWRAGRALPYGLGRWAEVFSQLRDVRPWGVQDRLLETGVLEDWRERVAHNAELIPCQIELWFRSDPRRRQIAGNRVRALVEGLRGQVVQEATIEEIAYHAMSARLPVAAVQQFVTEEGRDVALVQCEQIQFFRASGQMAGIIVGDERVEEAGVAEVPGDLKDAVVALLDGLPLQNHRRLENRLRVDDPDVYEADYPARERLHGTAMASLIVHGDLNDGGAPLGRRLYVRPILRPDSRDWRTVRGECIAEEVLEVDLLHRAIRHMFEQEGAEAPAAPQVAIVNLSVGILDRPFEGAISPLARLLDWLAWKYRLLFVVSAGNRQQDIELQVPRASLAGLTAEELQEVIVRAVAKDARNRRLLSPSESVNVLTMGAVHADASDGLLPPNAIGPFVGQILPSPINAQGMGYRRAVKPEALALGGRVVLRQSLAATANASLELVGLTRSPGQRVACPGGAGEVAASWFTRGTSNAAALTSRLGCELYDVLEELAGGEGGEVIDGVPRSVWLKALLVHSASWGVAGNTLEQILRTPQNKRQFKEYVTRLLGYGAIDGARVRECTQFRATALGGGALQADQAHIHQYPLPPALSGKRLWRRLTITLAWLTPIHATNQAWRRAALWFTPAMESLRVQRREADWQAVQRGTLQHEVLEGERASAFVDGDAIEIIVNCRADAGAVEEPVPYALAVTLEVEEGVGVEIYDEIRTRVQAARVRIAPNA